MSTDSESMGLAMHFILSSLFGAECFLLKPENLFFVYLTNNVLATKYFETDGKQTGFIYPKQI